MIGATAQVLCQKFYQDRYERIPDGAPPYYVSPFFHFGKDNLGVEAASTTAEHFEGTPAVSAAQVYTRTRRCYLYFLCLHTRMCIGLVKCSLT